VEKLEREIEEALADILIHRNKKWRWPLMPAQRTTHLMAKAAVAVYEAALNSPEDKSTEESDS
jgi:hypothetical protein